MPRYYAVFNRVLSAVMMGFGGVTALGCSIGNGVMGLAWLSSGSILAGAAISGGAWRFGRRIDHETGTSGEIES